MPRLLRHDPLSIRQRPPLAALLIVAACLLAACHGVEPPVPTAPAPAPTAPAPAPTASVPAPAPPVSIPPTPPKEKTHQNTIKWSTASEVDNFGFDVYRGPSADGPFERLNEDPIEGGGTTDEPRRYAYVDDTIDPRKIYYYYVESISMAGDREKFTPIGKAAAKIPPEGGGEPR